MIWPALLLLISLAGAVTDLWSQVEAARADEAFAPPSAELRAGYSLLVRDLARAAVAGGVPGDATARAEALGLELDVAGDVLMLREAPGRAQGGGLLAIRLGPVNGELVLQAPHPFYDLHTGRVVAAMFESGRARAAQIATAHRQAGERKGGPSSDAAHNAALLFQSATLGLAGALPDPLFVQLHGFSSETTSADAVVSPGLGRLSEAELDRWQTALAPALGVADLRGGDQVSALAARTNVQGAALADRARFLHLELSLPLRERLRDDAAARQRLEAALEALARREAAR